jgi:hypothetical protein
MLNRLLFRVQLCLYQMVSEFGCRLLQMRVSLKLLQSFNLSELVRSNEVVFDDFVSFSLGKFEQSAIKLVFSVGF